MDEKNINQVITDTINSIRSNVIPVSSETDSLDFEKFTFTEEQSGPTIIRFENIRGTGQITEFGLVVIPEFGHFVLVVLVLSMTTMLIFGKKLPVFRKL